MLNDELSLCSKEETDKDASATNNGNSEKPKANDGESSTTTSPATKKIKHGVITPTYSTVTFKDVGGMDDMIDQVRYKLFQLEFGPVVIKHYKQRFILLHGPPGCGKTHFVRALAGDLGIPLLEVASTELVSGVTGESESKIRDAFDAAVACGQCILFIDDIDVICGKWELTENTMMRQMVAQMKECFDALHVNDPDKNVLVIVATNRVDSIDSSLRQREFFGWELAFGFPNEDARLKILKVLCKNLKLDPDINFEWLAYNTPCYVGVDLKTLVSKASKYSLSRLYKTLQDSENLKQNKSVGETSGEGTNRHSKDWTIEEDLTFFRNLDVKGLSDDRILTMQDFKDALQVCVPSSKGAGFASIPKVTWEDVGALEDIKEELRSTILTNSSTKGILLYGPKGCGKTLLAKAIANEFSMNFLAVNGHELLSRYEGESEKAVKESFERARASAPCVIFLQDLDVICPPRSSAKENAPIERVVNQLLTESCGLQDRKQVYLVAATNWLEKIDSAMLRPGRLEKLLYVGLPTSEGREAILNSQTKNKTSPKIEETLTLKRIATDERCNNFSGADLAYLVREAISCAVGEMIKSGKSEGECTLTWKHFNEAFNRASLLFSIR